MSKENQIYICEKCGKEFEEDWRKDKKTIRKFPIPRFCSKSCANSHLKTDAQKMIISKKLKESPKAKEARKKLLELKNSEEWKSSHNFHRILRIKRICPVCGNEFETTEKRNKIYCSNDCWKHVSGGFREGSTKNHVWGEYKGYRYNSSWELIWIKWALKNDIEFIRNKKGFDYIYNGRYHKFYPDFYLPKDDTYVEVKGITDDLWKTKKEYFTKNLVEVNKFNIKDYIIDIEDLRYCK